MNAVVYARYSSHRQGEQSIEGQLAEAKKFADAHGLTIIHEYCDRAMTGRNDNREQFQLMLSDAGKHAFDALIVWKTDRIGRNKEEIALNKYHLKKNGVKIYYVAEAIPDTPEGIILEAVIEGMAAYYSEQLSQNIRRGQLASANKAQSIGGNRPLGYKTGPDKKIVIDPETAPTVRLVYDLYAEGKTIAEIVEVLNQKGLRTLRGRPFTHNSLRTVLKNEKYIGIYTYKEDVRIEGAIPPIIDEETFYKVQELLKYNQKAAAHKNSKVDYLLTEKLFCGKCGAMMVGVCGTSKAGVRHYYYSCNEQRKRRCNKKLVRRDWIEELVLDYTIALVKNETLLEFIAENTYQYYLEQNTETAYTESLRKSLADVEKSIANLIKALEAGIFNASTKQRMDELEEQKTELQGAIAAAQLRQDLGLKKEHILYFLHRFADMDYTDEVCQKQLIKTFVNSVFVYDDKVVLTFNYSGDDRTITLNEIDAGLQHGVRLPRAMCHQQRSSEIVRFQSFFFFSDCQGDEPGKDRQMAEINKEARESFYKELTHRLTAEGYAVEPEAEGLLPVRWHGSDLCRITAGGGAQFREADLAPEGCRGAFDRAVNVAAEVKQYLQLMEAAPVLKAMSLDERYKLLADFNGAVLAGHHTSRGVQFVTWEWSYGRAGVWGGHYFGGNFAKAKRDFALRAELIDRDAIFEPEQLAEVYRAIHETLDGDNAITEARRKLLESAAEQIENAVPDLEQRVNQSNQQELELNMESGQSMI